MKIHILLFLSSIILLSACGSGDCIRGDGEVERRTLEVAPFDAIVVEGPIDVRLRRSSVQNVDIEVQPNIGELLETQVRDGVWHIRTAQCFRTRRDFIVHVTVPEIRSIAIKGSGDVTSEDQFDVQELDLSIAGSGDMSVIVNAMTVNASITGSGDMEIMGMCQEFTSTINGSGDIKAGDLQCARANADIVGSGDINLHVTDALEANVTGSGSIRYKGSPPRVNRNVTGSGDITAR
jgi:hypothetical protein